MDQLLRKLWWVFVLPTWLFNSGFGVYHDMKSGKGFTVFSTDELGHEDVKYYYYETPFLTRIFSPKSLYEELGLNSFCVHTDIPVQRNTTFPIPFLKDEYQDPRGCTEPDDMDTTEDLNPLQVDFLYSNGNNMRLNELNLTASFRAFEHEYTWKIIICIILVEKGNYLYGKNCGHTLVDELLDIDLYNVLYLQFHWCRQKNLREFHVDLTINQVADFLQKMIDARTIRCKSEIHIIGIQFGAHFAGNIGRKILDIGRITGISPSNIAPSDSRMNDDKIHTFYFGERFRLRSTDANFVDVYQLYYGRFMTDFYNIRTNLFRVYWVTEYDDTMADVTVLGFEGGPYCGVQYGGCWHNPRVQAGNSGKTICPVEAAYKLFTESLAEPIYARTCPSLNEYINFECNGKSVIVGNSINKTLRGVFSVDELSVQYFNQRRDKYRKKYDNLCNHDNRNLFLKNVSNSLPPRKVYLKKI